MLPSTGTIQHGIVLNGFEYTIDVESIANYTYAQAAPTKSVDVSAYGPLTITAATIKTGTNNKVYTVTANLNGCGSISNIIGLGKSPNSSSVLVNNFSATTLPTITLSGSLDTLKAANQIATFDLPFLGAPGSVTDLLVVVVAEKNSDTLVIPSGGLSFFD